MIPIDKVDRTWWFKLNGLLRRVHVSGAAGLAPQHLVLTEYPKSGGTWLSQMLAEATGIPYPRSRLPMLRPSVMHGCHLEVGKQHQTVVLFRDGRDVMVSYYFHLLMHNSLKSSQYVERMRREFEFEDIEDVRRNLPIFIERCFTGRNYPRFTWADFVRRWHGDTSGPWTSYERLHADTAGAMNELLVALGHDVSPERVRDVVERYSFERVSNRARGTESIDSFTRKGIVGDWKARFSLEARELFAHYAGDELKLLGYEADDRWVQVDSELSAAS